MKFMFILNRIITTRIDRGFCFDTVKLYVYDFKNMYSPSYSYYVSPFPIEFNYIKHMSEDSQDMIIDRILDAYVINGLGKYASNLDDIKKMINDNEEIITDEDLQYQNVVRRLVDTIDLSNIQEYADADRTPLKPNGHTVADFVDTAIANLNKL